MDTSGLAAVYFEEVRRHAGTDAAHLYGGFLATLTSWCEQHGIAYQGVPMAKQTELRAQLRDAGAEMMVVKNTLLRIAAERIGTRMPLQGNIDPALLSAPWEILVAHTREVLQRGDTLPAHIEDAPGGNDQKGKAPLQPRIPQQSPPRKRVFWTTGF